MSELAGAMELRGKVVLITGASTGIGEAAARALGARGAELFLAGRDRSRHQPVLDALHASGTRASYLPLELDDLGSVRACAEAFLALGRPLHVLINNAGIAGQPGRSRDGFELTFAVNHLGPFLLTERLLPALVASAPARIINVSSIAHRDARRVDWKAFRRPTRAVTGLPEYAASKLCNVLYAQELTERLRGRGVTACAVHPGAIGSQVWRHLPWGLGHAAAKFLKPPAYGARALVHCATDPRLVDESGLYYDECLPRDASPLAQDLNLARELVRRSRAWTSH